MAAEQLRQPDEAFQTNSQTGQTEVLGQTSQVEARVATADAYAAAFHDLDPVTGLGTGVICVNERSAQDVAARMRHFQERLAMNASLTSEADIARELQHALYEADPHGQESGVIIYSWANQAGEAQLSALTYGQAMVCVSNQYRDEFAVVAGGEEVMQEAKAELDQAKATAAREELQKVRLGDVVPLHGFDEDDIQDFDQALVKRFVSYSDNLEDLRAELEQVNRQAKFHGRLDTILSSGYADWLAGLRTRIQLRLDTIDREKPPVVDMHSIQIMDGDTLIMISGHNRRINAGDINLTTLGLSTAGEMEDNLKVLLSRRLPDHSYAFGVVEFPLPELSYEASTPQTVSKTYTNTSERGAVPSTQVETNTNHTRIADRLAYVRELAGVNPTAAQEAAMKRIQALLDK